MRQIDTYITEKLHLTKDIKRSLYPKTMQEAEQIVNDIVDSFTKDKYEVSFNERDDELYIKITFEKNQHNTILHDCGYKAFIALYDEEKYKKYNRGTDWWVSSPTRIVLKFEYK